MGHSQRFRSYCPPKPLTPSGFFLKKNPPCTEARNGYSNCGTARISRPGKRFFLIVAFLFVSLWMLSLTGGCKQGPWQLWHSYSARFIDPQNGRVFDPNGDQHTTSEGQAYALFFALAGNDRATFDRCSRLDPDQSGRRRSCHPSSRVALGKGQGRRVEGSRRQLGLRRRCLDCLHAHRGRPSLELPQRR